MSYSKIEDPAIKVKEQHLDRMADGSSVVLYSGVVERKKYRYYWINTAELQSEINTIQTTEAGNGWKIDGVPTRVPVHEVIDDLFNVTVSLYRYVNE